MSVKALVWFFVGWGILCLVFLYLWARYIHPRMLRNLEMEERMNEKRST